MRIELKKSRINNKCNVKDVAEILNISASYYYNIENGNRNPSIKIAKKLEIIFNTPMEQLFPDIFEKIS